MQADDANSGPDNVDLDDDDDDKDDDGEEEDAGRAILELSRLIRDSAGLVGNDDEEEAQQAKLIWRDVKRASLPFLRCAALLYHHLTCVPGPPGLVHFQADEFSVLADYLSLPTSPRHLMEKASSASLVRRWAGHPKVGRWLADRAAARNGRQGEAVQKRLVLSRYPLKLNGLVSLPADYSELINCISGFVCPKSQCDDSRVPAMCLVCGAVMCSQSYCCQTTLEDGKTVGACTAHSESCGGGCGIFLRVRECKVVLLAGRTKGCFIQPPYVDQYGETDTGLKRGNPLRLCPDRYRKIYQIWLNHRIPEEISHTLEANQFYITTPWFHL